jgi:hypothetical protein
MKQFPKIYEDISRKPSDKIISNISSSFGSVEDLASKFRSFFKEAHLAFFDIIVKQVWLEQKFIFHGTRRNRNSNGYGSDWAYSYFMRSIVGISQKPLTINFIFRTTPTYFKDFFPNFSDHDPFEEPEYFKYPYKHVNLDHLTFVYQYHDRLELLDEAEKKLMNSAEFSNFAANHALSYRDDSGKQIYSIVRSSYIPYIKKEK